MIRILSFFLYIAVFASSHCIYASQSGTCVGTEKIKGQNIHVRQVVNGEVTDIHTDGDVIIDRYRSNEYAWNLQNVNGVIGGTFSGHPIICKKFDLYTTQNSVVFQNKTYPYDGVSLVKIKNGAIQLSQNKSNENKKSMLWAYVGYTGLGIAGIGISYLVFLWLSKQPAAIAFPAKR